MFNNTRIFLPAALLAVGFFSSTPAKASLLFGTVNFNGNTTISQGLIHFIDPSGNPNGQVTVTSSTGDFSGDAGGVGFLKDINNSSFPIPTGAGSLPDFITAPAFPSTTHFTMTFLFPGVQGVAGCITGPNCTPPSSPFNLTNTSPSTSTASFAVAGMEIDSLTGETAQFFGVFTAQFDRPFQAVLAQLAADGSITTSFSGTIAIPSQVPEPGSLSTAAAGVVLLGMVFGIQKYRRYSSR